MITDLAGNQVKDTNGNAIGLIRWQYSDFNGASEKSVTIDNLPAGQYLVREQLNGTAYDNSKYTIVNESDPESRIVTVKGRSPGKITFTSTYTEVKANPVKVEVVLSNMELRYRQTVSQ